MRSSISKVEEVEAHEHYKMKIITDSHGVATVRRINQLQKKKPHNTGQSQVLKFLLLKTSIRRNEVFA